MPSNKPVTLATAGRAKTKCPTCGAPSTRNHRPFCSRRCADVDLGRWLGEVYTVPKMELDEGDEALLAQAAMETRDPDR